MRESFNSRPSRRTALVCGAALVACAGWAIFEHLSVTVLPYDDAFITYRYVENLVRGAGLTYNPPEHVWGFTSPLYVLWLALLRVLIPAVDLPTLAVRGNVVFVLAIGVGTLLLIHRYIADIRIACVGACVLLVHPSLLSISAGGMESALFVSLILFTFVVMTSAQFAIAGALIGFSLLARPEAVILLPIALIRYWRAPRQLLSVLLIAGAVVGVWLAFAAAYYHSVVPLPIIAKNRPLYPLPPGYALKVLFGYLGPALFGDLAPASFTRSIAAAAVLAVGTAGSLMSPLRRRRAWMPGVFAILAIALYGYGNPMFFEWYWPAILGTTFVAVIVGCFAASLFVARGVSTSSAVHKTIRGVTYAAGPAWILIVTISAYGDNAGGHSKSIRFVDQDGTRLRILAYRQIGERLTASMSGNQSLAAPEVGALGYFFAGRVIDAGGLVSPEAIQFLPVPKDERLGPTVGAISVELVRSTNPDWVVSMPIFAQRSLLRSDWFLERYELQSSVPLPKICFDSSNVLVFKRKSP